jgi:uncharacterized membrane protein
MTSQFLIKFGQRTALISFLGGALILGLYYFTAKDSSLFIGYIYILTAALINLALLARILLKAFVAKPQERKLYYTVGIMLLNIPAALLMFWFVNILLSTMRVTVINSTSQDISEITIEGCEKRNINSIEAGESKTVWIKIPGDCGIYMSYKQGIDYKKESVSGYLSGGMGGKMTHNIGTNSIKE